ncbi:MAG: hypothetical protein L6420_09075 [Elusimicrobia bacterium]|nr:hypothetical protein [Elusimicrobiota bacterium]
MNIAYPQDTADLNTSDYFKFDIKHLWKKSIETADSINANKILEENTYSVKPIFKIQIKNKIYNLNKPINVKISSDNETFFAENETLSLYGCGENEEEAINDLCVHIIHYYEYYKNIASNKIAGNAIKLKALYEDLLME